MQDIFFPKNDRNVTLVFPAVVDIELTNCCNFKCLMCASGLGLHRRPKGFMDRDVFRKVLDESTTYQAALRFIRWGEPSLHPDFSVFLRAVKERGLHCHINTNGSSLSKQLMNTYLETVDSIKFSFQGVNSESYREMRNCEFFETLIERIRTFHELRGGRETPYIRIATSITHETPVEVSAFKALASKIADQVTVTRTVLEHIEPSQADLNKEEKGRLQRLKRMESVVKQHPLCFELWSTLSVNFDGSVSACCRDYDNLMIAGTLDQASLQEIWNGGALRRFREEIILGRHAELPLCRYCFANQGE